MLGALFHRLVPASAYGGETAFSTLSKIDAELRQCQRADSAVAALERSKADLYARLSGRFAPVVAQALTLKVLNLFLARFHFNARSSLLLSRPFGLVVDPSNMCQLACPGCVHSTRLEDLKLFDWPSGTLSQECFSALLKLYGPYAIGVYFCNYGEPLLNLATPKLIRLAKTYLLGTALSTSLSIRKFDADAYVESGLDLMVLSIDGATQPVYEQYRRNGDIELVFSNIRKLVSAKRRLGKRTPVLSWNFLAFEHNAHEIPQAVRMAHRLGVNRFRVVNPFDVRWDDPNVHVAPIKGRVQRLDSPVGLESKLILSEIAQGDGMAMAGVTALRWHTYATSRLGTSSKASDQSARVSPEITVSVCPLVRFPGGTESNRHVAAVLHLYVAELPRRIRHRHCPGQLRQRVRRWQHQQPAFSSHSECLSDLPV